MSSGLKGPNAASPWPEQHSIDNVLAVDGSGKWPFLYPMSEKERMPQIEAQKNINRGKIAVFVEIRCPTSCRWSGAGSAAGSDSSRPGARRAIP